MSNSFSYTPAAPFFVTYAVALGGRLPGVDPRLPRHPAGLRRCGGGAGHDRLLSRVRLVYPDRRLPFPKTWVALSVGGAGPRGHIAGSEQVRPLIHPDALALLVSVGIFLALVCYLRSPTWAGLLLLAVGPAAGFLTNQFLLSWGAVIALVLLLDRPRDWETPGCVPSPQPPLSWQ